MAGTVGLGAFTDIIVTSPIEVSFGELLAPRISGGIVLCPATLFLLSAVSTQRVGFGLLLIVIGVVMVYACRFMSSFHSERVLVTRWLPLT
ncbi:MAG TPA: hypothetical protein VGR30_05800 [Candidatus Binatia bacterium]|nr:hypothetical protein [Candidatus Binatia bacterium]